MHVRHLIKKKNATHQWESFLKKPPTPFVALLFPSTLFPSILISYCFLFLDRSTVRIKASSILLELCQKERPRIGLEICVNQESIGKAILKGSIQSSPKRGEWQVWNSCQVGLLYPSSSIWLFLIVGSKIELPIQTKFLWGKNWKRWATVSSYLWWSDLIGSGQPEYISMSPLLDYRAHCITEIGGANSPRIKIGPTRSRLREKNKRPAVPRRVAYL